MISFRYHLVTIAAIFLALALGVAVGTTVVNQGVISELRHRTTAAAEQANLLRTQLKDLETREAAWLRYGSTIEPLIVQGQLAGSQVTIVTQETVDASEVAGVRKVLESAGATVVAEVVITNRMALTDANAVSQLQGLVGASATPSATPSSPPASGTPADPALAAEAASLLAQRLATGADPSDPNAPDLLDGLRNANFLTIRGGATPGQIGGAQTSTVLLSGGTQPVVVPASAFLEPLARELVGAGMPVVAVDTSTTLAAPDQDPFVSQIRADGGMDGRLVTVDDGDQPFGRVAVVLGLRDLLNQPGQGGDYGLGGTALIPSP